MRHASHAKAFARHGFEWGDCIPNASTTELAACTRFAKAYVQESRQKTKTEVKTEALKHNHLETCIDEPFLRRIQVAARCGVSVRHATNLSGNPEIGMDLLIAV